MVLVVNGVLQEEAPTNSRSLYAAHPIYRETAAQLQAIPPKLMGPDGLLYVLQREMAATLPHDSFRKRAVALAHLDGTGTEDAAAAMIQKVTELAIGFLEGRLELQLVGGYSDPRNCSEDIFYNILCAFHKQPVEVDLTLCCIGEVNTTVRGGIHWPVIYGIGVDVKTGEIFPANFPDKGPDQALRNARQLTGGQQVLDIYDCTLGLLRIGPFNYDPLRGVDLWLAQTDQFILQHLSSTPEVEPPHFVSAVRTTLKYIQDNQFPAVTVFRDNRPRYYRRDEVHGGWQPMRY